jgi:transposase InsO family protein
MSQIYHNNAKTNIHNRKQIRNSDASLEESSVRYQVSVNTIQKWKNRENPCDKSSRPHKIEYALTALEKALVLSIRRSSWQSLDLIHDSLLVHNPKISKSSVYRTLLAENLNKVPLEKREVAKKFKEYEPGYLHLDVTYLPKFDGQSYYLFVAIDRATRLMYYTVYQQKTTENTENFVNKCADFFPFKIQHILTDNGLEFSNVLIKSKKGNSCEKPSKLDVFCQENKIQRHLTRPATPKTNGMVERVNGTIKSNTILEKTYNNPQEMTTDLTKFLISYILYRRHGSLKKELKVNTPILAIEKWYELKPELFRENPQKFREKVANLAKSISNVSTTTL